VPSTVWAERRIVEC